MPSGFGGDKATVPGPWPEKLRVLLSLRFYGCRVNDNKIYIDFHIIVVYGVSIATVTENLIQNVKYRVEKFTGMSVEKINIYVEGVRIVD